MSQVPKVASQPGHAPRGSTSSRWPNSQAGERSPPDLPEEKDRHLESRDSHLRLAAGGWENDLNSSSTSEASPVFVMRGECRLRVLAPHAGLVQCRDEWIGQGSLALERLQRREVGFGNRQGAGYVFGQDVGCLVGSVWRANARRCFQGPWFLHRFGATLPRPGSPQALPRTHAIHSGRPKLPVGRWTDRIIGR